MSIEPLWVFVGRKKLGEREVPGPGANAWLRAMWASLKGGAWFWKNAKGDDSILPWCGGFIAWCMATSGLSYPDRYASARAWLDWGLKLDAPCLGCIVVFSRDGGGHVGMVVGKDTQGRLMVLGGNQGDAVSIAAFTLDRVLGYRFPAEAHAENMRQPEGFDRLPLYAANGAVSTNEA